MSGGGFYVRYFSDGTYDAYQNCTKDRRPEDEGKPTDDVYGFVLTCCEPVKGTWETEDGFFTLVKDGQRTYVGTIAFEAPIPDGSAPSGYEGGYPAPPPVVHADGTMSQVGPSIFRGMAYSGTPGGKLKALT